MFPDQRVIGGILVIGSLVGAIIITFRFISTNPNVRRDYLIWLIAFCFVSTGFTIAKLTSNNSEIPKPKAIRTIMRMQFYGDYRTPTIVSRENMSTSHPLQFVEQKIDSTAPNGIRFIRDWWTITLIYEHPIISNEITLNFNQPGFPSYELKFADERCAIYAINGSIPAGILEIEAK